MAEDRHYTVEELVALCMKHKIRRLKAGPNEIEMAPEAFAPEPMDLGEENTIPAPLTDWDFLVKSIAPEMRDGLDELKASFFERQKPPEGKQ